MTIPTVSVEQRGAEPVRGGREQSRHAACRGYMKIFRTRRSRGRPVVGGHEAMIGSANCVFGGFFFRWLWGVARGRGVGRCGHPWMPMPEHASPPDDDVVKPPQRCMYPRSSRVGGAGEFLGILAAVAVCGVKSTV